MLNCVQRLCYNILPCVGKERKKLFLSPLGGNDTEDGDNVLLAEDILVISFGVANECPGMMSEQKV